jgi:hypothetical protein
MASLIPLGPHGGPGETSDIGEDVRDGLSLVGSSSA